MCFVLKTRLPGVGSHKTTAFYCLVLPESLSISSLKVIVVFHRGIEGSRDETNDLPAEDPIEEVVRRCAVENELLRQLEDNFC